MYYWLYLCIIATLLVGCERAERTLATEVTSSVSSGFVHYDWIPKRMKHTMDHLHEGKVRDAEAFLLYDTGTVEVEFTVWGKRARSPNLIRGFSSRSETHEAYQTDGEFIKAINDAKVWWHDARKQGRLVQSTVRMTFDVSQLNDK